MNYKLCNLYGLKSKKKLMELLHIDKKSYCKSSFTNCNITPFLINENQRLVEAPSEHLKSIQRTILGFLKKLDFPTYVYSGIKGKSYIDNVRVHEGTKSLFKLDISKFFPNTSRNSIYLFFRDKMKTSPDVANILANFCAYDSTYANKDSIKKYINEKGITQSNHLITGSPVSSIMSYLANVDMFDELYFKSKNSDINMTVYVDDIVFSSTNRIPSFFRNEVIKTVESYGFKISKNKYHWFEYGTIKKVTGVILDKKQQACAPFKLMKKTHEYIEEINNGNYENSNKLLGCINTTEQIRNSKTKYKKLLQSKINNENKS